MINEIKEALDKRTSGEWTIIPDKFFANALGISGNGFYICGGLIERDANLIANTPTYLRFLLDELEKANKEVDAREDKYQYMFREMLPVAQQRDRYYAELEIMRTEHTAMRVALEGYAASGFEGAKSVLSTLRV